MWVARRSLCERTRIHAVPTIGRAGRRWRRWTSASGIAQEAHIGDLVLRVLGGHDVGAGTRLRAARATRAGARTRCNFMRTFRWMGCLAGGSGCAADAAANARWRPLAIPRTPWLPRDGSGSIRAAAQGHVRGERAPPRFRRGSPLRPRATYVPIRGRRDGAGRCRCRYWPARIQAAQAQFRRVKAGDQMKMTIAQAIAVRKG
jgi:hypothetical protein